MLSTVSGSVQVLTVNRVSQFEAGGEEILYRESPRACSVFVSVR
jgi:hypothetical protein